MWQAVIPAVAQLLDKLIPDPQAAAEAKLRAVELAQRGELAQLDADMRLALGQLDVNKAEASGDDSYTKRWRPTIGYILAAALAFQYLVNPMLLWVAAVYGSDVKVPAIALDDHMWELVLGMLGLAGWRSMDKLKGKA